MLAVAGACGIGSGLFGLVGARAAGSGCSSYPSYSALASAAGQGVTLAWPGLLPVEQVDAGLPQSQAQFDSIRGSTAQAGVPYSDVIAGNIGLTGVNRNDVPVFAVSSYPAPPSKVEKSTGGQTLTAETAADSASANTSGGAPGTQQGQAGQVLTSATADCGPTSSIEAEADNTVELLNIAGVLRIGSVSSHAKAVVDSAGHPSLDATMTVEGATVLGQRVAITDQGLAAAGSTTPLPNTDPLVKALVAAGISLHYVAAIKDAGQGQAFAPGLDVVVKQQVQGVGSGPSSTEFTLGRAYARASLTPGASAGGLPAGSNTSPVANSGTTPSASTPVQATGTPDLNAPPASAPSGATSVAAPRRTPIQHAGTITTPVSLLGRWSVARAYTALGIGLLLFTLSIVGRGQLTRTAVLNKLARRSQ